MLVIQFTTSVGTFSRIEVQQIEFVVKCRYLKCGVEFTTIDPDQLYCKKSHRVQSCKLGNYAVSLSS